LVRCGLPRRSRDLFLPLSTSVRVRAADQAAVLGQRARHVRGVPLREVQTLDGAGAAEESPVPMMIEQSEPGGVSRTTR
jgi:hypothetical protein